MADRQQDIVRRWFAEWTSDPPIYGRATKWLMELVDRKPERAWSFILALIEFAPSEEALGSVAAGPLEDLLNAHGPDFIDRIESLAASNPRLKVCLRGVWGWSSMDPSVYSRMRRAAGVKSTP